MPVSFILPNASLSAVRDGITLAIATRVDYAQRKGGGTPALDSALKSMRNAGDYTLAPAVSLAFNVGAFMTSHERDGSMCNAYAMQKLPLVLNMLAGGHLMGGRGNPGTLRATLNALRGDTSVSQKDIAFAINDYMNEGVPGGTYAAGGTQASSSLRVLEALGVVRVTGRIGNGNLWGISDAAMFAFLRDNANGISKGAYAAPASEEAPTEAPLPLEALPSEEEIMEAPAPAKRVRKSKSAE